MLSQKQISRKRQEQSHNVRDALFRYPRGEHPPPDHREARAHGVPEHVIDSAGARTQEDLAEKFMAAEVARCMYRLEVISAELERRLFLSITTVPDDDEGDANDSKELEKLADFKV